MELLSEVIDNTTAGLYRAGDRLEEILEGASKWWPKPKVPTAYVGLLRGFFGLLVAAVLDRMSGHASAMQFLYLGPIWLAFEAGSLGTAACVALLVVPVSAYTSGPAHWGTGTDLLVRTALMASVIAILTYHGRRFRSTRENASRDALTGAFNRAAFETMAAQMIEKAHVDGEALCLAVIDCDHFKTLNDVKGHAFGDQVLKAVVRVLTAMGPDTFVGRTGGDEFVVIARKRNVAQVQRELAVAMQRFTDATIVLGMRASFTAGLSQIGPGGFTYADLLESADRNMYRGKAERDLALQMNAMTA